MGASIIEPNINDATSTSRWTIVFWIDFDVSNNNNNKKYNNNRRTHPYVVGTIRRSRSQQRSYSFKKRGIKMSTLMADMVKNITMNISRFRARARANERELKFALIVTDQRWMVNRTKWSLIRRVRLPTQWLDSWLVGALFVFSTAMAAYMYDQIGPVPHLNLSDIRS